MTTGYNIKRIERLLSDQSEQEDTETEVVELSDTRILC